MEYKEQDEEASLAEKPFIYQQSNIRLCQSINDIESKIEYNAREKEKIDVNQDLQVMEESMGLPAGVEVIDGDLNVNDDNRDDNEERKVEGLITYINT